MTRRGILELFRAFGITTGIVALACISGCVPESESDLPASCLHDEPLFIGEFYSTDGKSYRTDVRIAKSENQKGLYDLLYTGQKDAASKVRLYKIGETLYLSMKTTTKDDVETGGYWICRVKMTRTQFTIEILDKFWFVANPDALPNTQVHNEGIASEVKIKAPSEKLRLFLELHAESKRTFVETSILFNRVGT